MNNSTSTTGTIDHVTLSLDTYNKLQGSAVALDHIISNTLAAAKLEPREETAYDSTRVKIKGCLMLPKYVLNGIANGIIDMLGSSDSDYVLSLQENDKHYFDLTNFTFESYVGTYKEIIAVDLLDYPTFRKLWDAAEARNKYLEQDASGLEPDTNENAKVFETDLEFAGKFEDDADDEADADDDEDDEDPSVAALLDLSNEVVEGLDKFEYDEE